MFYTKRPPTSMKEVPTFHTHPGPKKKKHKSLSVVFVLLSTPWNMAVGSLPKVGVSLWVFIAFCKKLLKDECFLYV